MSHQSALDSRLRQYPRRYLFDGKMCGVDIRNAFLVEQGFGRTNLNLALLNGGIAAVGLALVANGAEPLRVDGQSEQLAFVLLEGGGQTQVVEVIFGEGVVAHMNAELQGHVQRRGCFARAGNAGQDDVGLVVVAGAGTVVIVQGEVYGVDAYAVGFVVDDGMRLPDDGGRGGTQLGFKLAKVGLKHVHHEGVGGGDDVANLAIDDGVDNDGANAIGFRNLIDLADQ